ncbi:MAG: MCE family protein, partial [Betaproteobacteria bacterium]|nr:MCE family protein [Betaproteobacteria bacterium]
MAQQQSTARRDLAVGVFVLIGLLALLFLALKVGNMGGFAIGPSYQLRAKFDNIGGLKVRAPVKSAGVVVGRVVSIRLDPKTYQ